MKKNNKWVAKNVSELAEIMGLSAIDASEIELRSDLNFQIIKAIKENNLTHAEVAKMAGTSRTRVTAIVNKKTIDISTDLMLRVLHSLGYKTKLSFVKMRKAA